MTTKEEILEQLRNLKPTLNKEFGVKNIGVFGSFAKGQQTELSDIDILVELEKPIGWKYFTIEPFLQKLLGRKVDLVTEKALRQELKTAILAEVHYA